jgi:hypothetical protein
MTSALARMQAQVAAVAETAPDMTEIQKGGTSRLLPEGYAFARMVEYIELGNQPQEFGGKAKEPALEVQLAFALYGEGYANEDGTPYIIRPFSMAISRNEKAKAYLLFKLLNWQGNCTHFAQFLGQGFLAKIVTYKPKDATKKPSSTIDLKGFLPPIEAMSKQPYPIPVPTDDLYRVFFWDRPTKEDWDSLEVKGNYDDGKSKNYLQNLILAATDFYGSPLEALIGAQTPALPAAPAAVPAMPAVPSLPINPVAVPAVPQVPALFQAPVQPPVGVAPGLPSPIASTVTSPSSPALPVMPPAMPALPKF